LVGWSYGGAVVQTFAAEAPQRVERLVLVAAVGPAQPEEGNDALGHILNSSAGTAILQWVASVPPLSRRMTHDTLVQAFARADAIPPGWVEYTRAMLALPGTLQSFVWEAQRGHASELHPESLNVPAIVIQGTDDYLVPRFVGEDLHRRLPQSKLVLVPHGSHMLPVTHADLLAQEIHTLGRMATD
jgi:pimeloyl-ACP methyl ester carboxylesterase